MGKKTVFTNITPFPPQVTREVAIAMLHNHDEMVELNPLVIEHHPIKAPRDAPKDEYLDCAWQELTDRISYLPGGVVKGKVTYKACFHNLPYGLQTHIYAPMGLDIREKWSVCGTLPGEPDEPRELGLDVPRRGLYLREDGEIKCNILMSSFVRKNLDNAHKILVQRILSKTERIQALISASTTSSPVSVVSQQRQQERSMLAFGPRPSMSSSSSSMASPQSTVFSVAPPGTSSVYEPSFHERDPELASVHPALREQYQQSQNRDLSRSDTVLPAYQTLKHQKGQFYHDDLAKRPAGKQFAVELEGSPGPSPAAKPLGGQPSMSERDRCFVSELEGTESVLRSPLPIRSSTAPDERLIYDASSMQEDVLRLSYLRSASEAEVDTAAFGKTRSNQNKDRFSTVSGISAMPTPKATHFAFNEADNRFSVMSAMTEASTPKLSGTVFSEQQTRR